MITMVHERSPWVQGDTLAPMTTEQLEREDKYDVPEDFVLPDLTEQIPRGEVTVRTYQLEATYYDTDEDHLGGQGITLRKRRGGHGAGWHLKLPADAGRWEITVDSRATSPPAELTSLLLGVRRGRRLVRKAQLSTTRNSITVTDGDGRMLAEVADDQVHAVRLDDHTTPTEWREIEVELAPDADDAVLTRIGELLRKAGAKPAASGSKFARAMGPAPSHGRPDGLAGVVDDYLQAQYDAILAGDVGLRREEDRIHPTRVAIRRLHSTLRVFGALFDPAEAEHLQNELTWYAGRLGAVRDLDVQASRLTKQVEALPKEFVVGPVAAELEATLATERAEAWRKLRSAMNGKRYLALMSQLEKWRTDPPLTEAGHKKPRRVTRYVAAAEKQLRKRLREAAAHETDDGLFHRARKAAKRYRYANELAEPVLGAAATAAVAETKELQTLLGEHQDSVVSVAILRRLGASAGRTPGTSGFTYGVLLAQQLQHSAESRAEVARTRSEQ